MSTKKIEKFIKQKFFVIASFIIMLAMVITFSLVYTNGSSKANSTRLNLSEKQLLLLNNYLYLNNATKNGAIMNTINSLKSNNNYDSNLIQVSLDTINTTNMISILTEIEQDNILSNLVVVDSINTNIKAICLVPKNKVNSKNAEAIIVFQGTNPNQFLLQENIESANETDTKAQLSAGTFHESCEMKYNVTNVTGHSTGGNLAQYVTITNGQNIRNCISFNSQGFSQEFIDKYQEDINIYEQKIVSISSYKEPVHTLLTNIVSNTIFVATDNSLDSNNSHSPSVLFAKEYFDKYGMYNASVLTDESSTVTAQ